MPPALVLIHSQRPLAPNVTSVASDKCDSEMIPGAVYNRRNIYHIFEDNPGNPQLEDGRMKAVRPVIASNGVA